MRTLIQGTWVIFAVSLAGIVTLVGLKLSGFAMAKVPLALVFSVPSLFVSLVALPIFYWSARRYEGVAEQTILDPIAHWQCEPSHWQNFYQSDWARTRSKLVWLPLKNAAAGGALVGFAGLVAGKFLPAVAIGVGIGLAVALFEVPLRFFVGRANYRRRQAGAGEIRVGTGGLSIDGQLYIWHFIGTRLVAIKTEEGDPQRLIFRIEMRRAAPQEVRVPLPPDSTKIIERIVHRLLPKG